MDRLQITVQPMGPGPPAAVRIRRLLKVLLRAYGLRCVSLEPAGSVGAHTEARPKPPKAR